jgi:dihydroxyacetone kinase-like predicted kinase
VSWQATLDGQLVGAGVDIDALGLATLARVSAADFDVVTVYYGAGGTPTQANRLARRIQSLYPNVELDVVNGGQPQPYYIIALE